MSTYEELIANFGTTLFLSLFLGHEKWNYISKFVFIQNNLCFFSSTVAFAIKVGLLALGIQLQKK